MKIKQSQNTRFQWKLLQIICANIQNISDNISIII